LPSSQKSSKVWLASRKPKLSLIPKPPPDFLSTTIKKLYNCGQLIRRTFCLSSWILKPNKPHVLGRHLCHNPIDGWAKCACLLSRVLSSSDLGWVNMLAISPIEAMYIKIHAHLKLKRKLPKKNDATQVNNTLYPYYRT